MRPADVEARWFEFFPVGSTREVLLLGDVMDLLVHYVKDSRRKKLCKSEYAPCELCDEAASSRNVEACQAEYYAPAYVRRPKEAEFHQKVAVFPAVSAVILQELFPLGQMRGKRVEVTRKGDRKLYYKALPGMPKGIPDLLPAAFDLHPFIRARYGQAEEPGCPLVVLPPLRAEIDTRAGDRPARLTLRATDVDDLAPKTVDELRAYIAKCEESGFRSLAARARQVLNAKLAGGPVEGTASADDTVVDRPPPAAAVVEPAEITSAAPPPAAPEKPDPDVLFLKAKMSSGEARYGPRRVAREAIPAGDVVDQILTDTTGEIVCREEKEKAPCLNGTGHHSANGNGKPKGGR